MEDRSLAARDPDGDLRRILTRTRVIAVVGFSANPARPSHDVAAYLQAKGYRIIPVNPGLAGTTHLGETAYADLASIPAGAGVDMVDIFRRSDQVAPVVDAALESLPGLRTVWMQLGVSDPAAAARARARGIDVVENRCPKMEIPRLFAGASPLAAG